MSINVFLGYQKLFSFHKVSYISIVVNSSTIVPCSAHNKTSSRYKNEEAFGSGDFSNEALNHWEEKFLMLFKFYKLLQSFWIPAKNTFKHPMTASIIHGLNSIEGKMKWIVVGEVEAGFKIFFYFFKIFPALRVETFFILSFINSQKFNW